MSSRSLAWIVLAAVTVATALAAQATAAPVCDNKCRMRDHFYDCYATENKCIFYSVNTCMQCVYGGRCVDKGDYTWLKPNCLNPINGQNTAPAIYHDECTADCPCTVYTVEASGSGPATTIALPYAICRS